MIFIRLAGLFFAFVQVTLLLRLVLPFVEVPKALQEYVPTLLGEPYGADMQMFVNVGGTPCVIFGPGDVRVAHSADEHVPIAEVEDCARVLAAWVRRELIAGS